MGSSALRFFLFSSLLSSFGIACTVSVANPTAASTVSGTISLIPILSSCPSVTAVKWQQNDFYNLSTVRNYPLFTYNWDTRFVLDGPSTIRAIAYDDTGNIVVTSADVAFSTKNYSTTCTVNSPASFQSTPTITGTLTIDFTCTGISLASVSGAVDGIPWFYGYLSGVYPTGGNAKTLDTTTLLNGIHLINIRGDRTASPNVLGAFQLQFLINVSNTATNVVAVRPDISDIVLTVGGPACTISSVATGGCGSYLLSPVLQKADGSTTAGTFAFTHLGACNLNAVDAPDNVDFRCTAGNAFSPLSGFSTGAGTSTSNWISLSSSSGATTTITALSRGHSVIKIVDNISGKFTYIQVAIKSYTAPPHFAVDGSIRTSYKGDGKDIFKSSIFNLGSIAGGSGFDAGWPTHLIQSKLNSLELEYSLNGYGFANLAAWQSAWLNGPYKTVTNNLNVLPGFCIDGSGDGAAFSGPGGLNDTASGPSASWSPPPLTQALLYMASHGVNVCGTRAHDEIDAIWLFNPEYSLSKVDGTLVNVVVSGCPSCIARWTTAKATGKNAQYGGFTRVPGAKVLVQNASSTGLNGLHTVQVNRYWCGDFNLWWVGDCGGINGPNAGPIFTFDTDCVGCVNGTYTDAGMNIAGWGDTGRLPVFAGESPTQNNSFTVAHAQMVAANAADAYPTRATSDPIGNMNWSRKGTFVQKYRAFSGLPALTQSQEPVFFWGNSYRELFDSIFSRTWGNVNAGLPANATLGLYCPYWQCDQTGYVTWQQDVPVIMQEAIDSWNFNIGGRSIVPVMSGSCMTGTPYDNIPYQTNGPMEWHRLVFSGNSDSTMNGHWFAGLPCNNGLGHEIFHTSGNITGCTVNASGGTVTIRGLSHNIVPGGAVNGFKSTNFTIDGVVPQDLAYGEGITIAGQPAACNIRAAFYGYINPTTVSTTNFANSTGTGGMVLINDDGGYPNPSYDVLNFNTRATGMQPDAIYNAGLGVAGIKSYDANTQAVQLGNIGNSFPCSPACTPGLSPNEDPFINSNIDIHRRWQTLAHTNAFLTRVAPFNFGDFLPSPYLGFPTMDGFAPSPDVVSTTHSSPYGIILSCVNFSEVSTTITVPHSRYQVATNPVSIYHLGYPEFWTDIRTGALTTENFTLQSGEAVSLLYHNGAASYVQNVQFSFILPAIASKVSIHYTYVYADPLPLSESIHSIICSSSPCSIPLDSSLSDIFWQRTYLDGSNNIVARSATEKIPSQFSASSPPPGGIPPIWNGSVIINGQVVIK